MKKRKRYRRRQEKTRMCDPSMCEYCNYIGEGDFVCEYGPDIPTLVVEGWVPNKNAGCCKRRTNAGGY